MIVGYLTFGRDELGYGMEIVRRDLVAAGHQCYRVTPKTARVCDALVFSLFWWEHLFLIAQFLRDAGISKANPNRPRLVAGGFITFNPVPILCYVDAVIVGDGDGIAAPVVSGDYSAECVLTADKPTVEWRNADPIKPICHETNDIARIELARGCRHRCKFCAVAHLKPYREAAYDDVKACLRSTRLKRVSLFAPEPTMHTRDAGLTALCTAMGKSRQDSDVRLDRLAKRSDSVPRVGVEGLSERLRKSVGKHYSDNKILESVKQAIQDGRKGLFMYIILDLPGETDDDWQAFGGLLRKIGEIPGAGGFLLKPSPSVFMPTPFTPMASESINWDRQYGAKWETFFGRGDDRDWNVMMAERSRVFSPHSRLLQMMATRAGVEFAEVERELWRGKAIRISGGRVTVADKPKLESTLRSRDLISAYCGKRKSGPWEIVKAQHA